MYWILKTVVILTTSATLLLPSSSTALQLPIRVTLPPQEPQVSQVSRFDKPIPFYGAKIVGYRIASNLQVESQTFRPAGGHQYLILELKISKPPFELDPRVGFREILLFNEHGKAYQYRGIPNEDLGWIQLEESTVPEGTKLVINSGSYEVVFEIPTGTLRISLEFRGKDRLLVFRKP